MQKEYTEHPVFKQLSKYGEFYEMLAYSIMSFSTMGTQSFLNIDTYVFESMQGTLESIQEILGKGRINDAYALLRKYYDAAIINIYTNLYLEDHFSIDNFLVEKINNWFNGKEQLPDNRGMINYFQKSKKIEKIYKILQKDKRYKELRDRCNDHTHYNFYYNILSNNNKIYLENRTSYLNLFATDLENIFILHLSLLFYIKDIYMMSSDYIDCLDCGITPVPDSQYFVAPFVQEIFDDVIKIKRMDLANEIKSNTMMRLK